MRGSKEQDEIKREREKEKGRKREGKGKGIKRGSEKRQKEKYR